MQSIGAARLGAGGVRGAALSVHVLPEACNDGQLFSRLWGMLCPEVAERAADGLRDSGG